jgi:hypothetical protein
VEVERGNVAKFLAFHEPIELHLERTLERPARLEKGAVALVTHSDILEELAVKFQIRMHVLELDPHGGCQTVAFAFGTLQIRSPGASPAFARTPRAKVGKSDGCVQTRPELIQTQGTFSLGVPSRKPLLRERSKLVGRQFTILISIAIFEEGRGE